MRFVDTNVLLYAVTPGTESVKADTARRILFETDVALSVQVLQEFFVQSLRPSRSDRLQWEEAVGLVEAWMRFPVAVTTPEVMQAAIATSDRFDLSYWDAAIIEAARTLGCDEVLSEDMSHGRDYGGVRVVNPFVQDP